MHRGVAWLLMVLQEFVKFSVCVACMALMYTPRKHYTSRHCVFQMVRAQRQLFELLVVHPEECSDASYVLVTAMVFAKGAQLEHGGLDDCEQCESALLVLECTCRTAHTHHAIWADLGLDIEIPGFRGCVYCSAAKN